jgi:PKD repeat protein
MRRTTGFHALLVAALVLNAGGPVASAEGHDRRDGGSIALPAGGTSAEPGDAPLEPNAQCSPVPGTPKYLIDTSSQGEPQPTTERSFGQTLYTAGFPGGNGQPYALINVGNDIRSFDISNPDYILSKGKTATGLAGDVHNPYMLITDPLSARDDFRWVYMGKVGNAAWVLDGNTFKNGTIGATDISGGTSGLKSNAFALSRVANGQIILSVAQTEISGTTVVSYVVGTDSGTGTIQGNNPASWQVYRSWQDGWGENILDEVQAAGELDSRLDSYVVMSVPTGPNKPSAPALVDIETGNYAFFTAPNGTAASGQIVFGRIGNDVYACINSTSLRRFLVFKINLSPTVEPQRVSDWVAWPLTSPVSGTIPNFFTVSWVNPSGVLLFGDINTYAGFAYNVSNPAVPTLIPGVAEWWYNNIVLDTGGSSIIYQIWEANSIGADSMIVSGNAKVHAVKMPCNLAEASCEITANLGTDNVAYPGEPVSFGALGEAAASYAWNFNGESTAGGKTTSYAFETTGNKLVTLNTTGGASGPCSAEKGLQISDPSVTVDVTPPNAVTSTTTVFATHVHDGNPSNGYPLYQWNLTDQGGTNANQVAMTTSGGPNAASWSFKLSQAANDADGYQICLDVRYSPQYTKTACAPAKVHVGPNAANFYVTPYYPTTASDVVLVDSSQAVAGGIQSFAWSVNGPAGFAFTPIQGNGYGGPNDSRNLTIPESVLVGGDYTATLTLGDAALSSNFLPQGTKSSATKSFTVGGSCTSASFRIEDMGGMHQYCDSGTSGGTSCSGAGSICSSGAIYVDAALVFRPACPDVGTTYQFNFGDGSTETFTSANDIQHTYTSPGSKTVRLTVDGTYVDTMCVTVMEAPCASPVVSFAYAVADFVVHFTNGSSNFTSLSWDFGDGATSSSTNPSHTYDIAGTYTVTLLATNGCSASPTNQVSQSITVPQECTNVGAPTNIAPSNGATSVDYANGIVHSWQAGAFATVYDLTIYSGGGCSNPLYSFPYLLLTSYTAAASTFQPNTTYSWRVTPLNGGCAGPVGPSSACWTYTTKASEPPSCSSVPAAPSTAVPASGAAGVAPTNVTFEWSDVSTTNCPATYSLRLYTTGCGSAEIFRVDNLSTTRYVYTGSALPESTWIHWQVIPSSSKGVGTASSCSAFQTTSLCAGQTPGSAAAIYPPSGAQAVETASVPFAWSPASCATSYDLAIYATADCTGSTPATFTYLTDTRYGIPLLPDGTDMSWSVLSRNAIGVEPGVCTNFRTKTTIPAPAARYAVSRGGVPVTHGPLRAGVPYQFDASSSTAGAGASLAAYDWTVTDAGAASGMVQSYAFAVPGTYTVALTVVQSDGQTSTFSESWTVVEAVAVRPVAFLIPAAAHAAGLNDTTWKTDLKIYNPDPNPLDVTIEFRAAGSDNTNAPKRVLAPIPPKSTAAHADLLLDQFGMDDARGAVFITYAGVEKLPVIQSNTANSPNDSSLAGGTYGQYIPAIAIFEPSSECPSERAAASEILLEGVQVSADPATGFRTNLGIVNLDAEAASFGVEIWSDSGHQIASAFFSIPPFGFQDYKIAPSDFPTLELPVPSAYVKVIPAAGARIEAYVSIIDNRSGDGTFFAGDHVADPTIWIAGAATAVGPNDTRWVSSLFLVNPFATAMPLRLVYTPLGAEGPQNETEMRIDLPAHGSRIENDVVGELFGATSSSGVISVSRYDQGDPAEYPFVSARTFNDATTGTFGQTIPAVSAADAIGAGIEGNEIHIPGLTKSSRLRTNVGLYNQSAEECASVHLILTDDLGNVLATKDVGLAAGEAEQINDLFADMGVEGPFDDATLVVSSIDGRGSVAAYASVVDNVTGDPMFLPGNVR